MLKYIILNYCGVHFSKLHAVIEAFHFLMGPSKIILLLGLLDSIL
jgi:hypothetical protein